MSTNNFLEVENFNEFTKIIKEFVNDIFYCFDQDLIYLKNDNNDIYIIYKYNKDIINIDISNISHIDELDDDQDIKFYTAVFNIYKYCISVYPQLFFDILYKNEEIFNDKTKNCYFLPSINFKELFEKSNDESNIKTTIWKYLQLILFNIVTNIKSSESFGDSLKLFEYINNEEFQNKLQSTFSNFENILKKEFNNDEPNDDNEDDESNNEDDESNNEDDHDDKKKSNSNNNNNNNNKNNKKNDSSMNIPDPKDIHEHINNLINGKIGSLAKELAEETTKDLDIDLNSETADVNELFSKLFKNPDKLMNLVKNIGSKLEDKMSNGSIKESDLLEEAVGLFKNMNNMPGMENIQQMMESMNLKDFIPPNTKYNKNAFENMMNNNIKKSKTKERMKSKLDNNKKMNNNNSNIPNTSNKANTSNNFSSFAENNALKDINNNLKDLMKNIESNNLSVDNLINNIENSDTNFIDDILKQQSNTNKKVKKSVKK